MNFDTHDVEYTATFMSSRDLMAINLIPDIMRAGIDSFKIEGRMKSNMYVANTVSVYRHAIDEYYKKNVGATPRGCPNRYESELKKTSNRTFCSGSFEKPAGSESVNYESGGYVSDADYIGTVKEIIGDRLMVVDVKAPFFLGDTLELLNRNGTWMPFKVDQLITMANEGIHKTNPNMCVKISFVNGAEYLTVIRKIK